MKRSRTRRSRPYSGKRRSRRQRTVRRKPVKRTTRKSAKSSRRSLKGGMKKKKNRTPAKRDKLEQKKAYRKEGTTNREKAEEFSKQVRVTDDNSSSFENYLADVRKVSISEINSGTNPYSGLPFNFNAQTIQSLSAGELPTSPPPVENQKFVKIVSQEDPPPPSPEGSSDESPDQCEGKGCFSSLRKKLTLGKHKSDSDAKKTPENETTPLLATGYDPSFRKPSQTVRLVDLM